MSQKKMDTKAVWAIIISLIVLIGIFLVLNNSSFLQKKTEPAATKVEIGKETNKQFNITVYYFSSKKSAAQALTYYFKERGYNVDMQLATSVDALKGSEKSPSHIFFNRSEIDKAMGIKQLIEEVIGFPVNAYRFHEEQSDPSMMMVFTEFEA